MLMAEETVLNTSHVVTGIFMVATAITTYLAGRDRLKFNSRTQSLESRISEQDDIIKRQTEALRKCEVEHKETQQKLAEMNNRCSASEKSQAHLEGELAYLKAENVNMREEQKSLRELLMKRIAQ